MQSCLKCVSAPVFILPYDASAGKKVRGGVTIVLPPARDGGDALEMFLRCSCRVIAMLMGYSWGVLPSFLRRSFLLGVLLYTLCRKDLHLLLSPSSVLSSCVITQLSRRPRQRTHVRPHSSSSPSKGHRQFPQIFTILKKDGEKESLPKNPIFFKGNRGSKFSQKRSIVIRGPITNRGR